MRDRQLQPAAPRKENELCAQQVPARRHGPALPARQPGREEVWAVAQALWEDVLSLVSPLIEMDSQRAAYSQA